MRRAATATDVSATELWSSAMAAFFLSSKRKWQCMQMCIRDSFPMTKEYDRVTVVDHPMVQHKLSKLRNKDTSSKDFRALVRELALFEGYEATRDLALEDVEVETPICKTTCKQVSGKKMVIVPILRAGLGMVEGVQELMPSTFCLLYTSSALLTVVTALLAVGVFFAAFETSRPSLRQVMPTVVLAALAAAGRMLFAPIPDFKPVSGCV